MDANPGGLGLDSNPYVWLKWTSSQWSLGGESHEGQSNPSIATAKWQSQVTEAWCRAMSQLFLSLAGWPCTSSFTYLERWTWGLEGPFQLSNLYQAFDHNPPLFLPSHMRLEFSNAPWHHTLPAFNHSLSSRSPISQASCFPGNLILPMAPRAQKGNPSSPS